MSGFPRLYSQSLLRLALLHLPSMMGWMGLLLLMGCATQTLVPSPRPAGSGVAVGRPAEVALKTGTGEWTIYFKGFNALKTPDANGWIELSLPRLPDTLFLEGNGRKLALATGTWRPPYRYAVEGNGLVSREGPWVEFRRYPADTVFEATFSLLCKTAYPAEVSINGTPVKQYQTGIFFRDLAFQPGLNRIEARAVFQDGQVATYAREVYYQTGDRSRQPFPLWIDTASVSPEVNTSLLTDDRVLLAFRGSKAQQAKALVKPGRLELPMSRQDFSDNSLYQMELPLQRLKAGKTYRVLFALQGAQPDKGPVAATYAVRSTIQVKRDYEYPMLRTVQDKAPFSYNLGPIRLGGPMIAEYPKGIVLQASGKVGNSYRVRLDDRNEGFIPENFVEVLPQGTIRPTYFLQSVSVGPSEKADVLRIPWSAPVPYAVLPLPDEKIIRITLYGVKTSSTWLSHRAGLKIIDKVTWQQTAPETYQMDVHLTSSRIWGYTFQPEGNSLVLRVKYPPVLGHENGKLSFKGFKVSIEAGHGGNNTGAEGLSGILEKDINLDVALRLEQLCKAAGMSVLQVRPTDVYMTLEQKRSIIEQSDADLHVSIHGNSGGGGYLRVGGVSTYYHDPFWADFAKVMYGELLQLGLDEFGIVGSFNYHVTRIASRPSILVEQAFLSHAGDEEKLASPVFRQQMAQKIFDGIVAYVRE